MTPSASIGTAIRSIVVAYFRYLFVWAPGLIRVLNPPFSAYLRMGLPAGPNALVSVRGRKTGQMRSFPSALMELNGALYLQAAYPAAQWLRNLRVAGEATVTRGGLSETYRAREMPVEEAASLMQLAVAEYPRSRFLRRVLGEGDRPPVPVLHYFKVRVDDTPEEYLALARRFPLIELTLAASQTRSVPL
jgi:deazaflavin-dependent oxidoreductase (nitroreductase family)